VLKISVIDTRTQRRLVLEGKLLGPWTAELRIAGQRAVAGRANRDLVIDMRNVTAIGGDGEAALLELMRQGAIFRSCGLFTKQLVKRLARIAGAKPKETEK